MICPNCGRNIPDGTQCPCSAGMAYSSNPAVNIVKSMGASTLFMVLAVLTSVSVVLSIITATNIDSIVWNAFYSFSDFVDPSVYYGMYDLINASSIFGAIVGATPAILTAVGMWLHFTASRNRTHGGLSTTGLTMIKVVNIVMFVLVCVAIAFVIFAFIMVFIALGATSSYYSYGYYNLADAMAVIIIIAVAVLVIAVPLIIAYYVCLLKTINRVKTTALTGVPDNRIPGFLVVMSYIAAAGSIISAFSVLFTSVWSALASLVSAATAIITALLLTGYKKQMSMLMFNNPVPVQMPVQQQGYAQPQTYQPQQAQPVQQPQAPDNNTYVNTQPQQAQPVAPVQYPDPIQYPDPVQTDKGMLDTTAAPSAPEGTLDVSKPEEPKSEENTDNGTQDNATPQ